MRRGKSMRSIISHKMMFEKKALRGEICIELRRRKSSMISCTKIYDHFVLC
jgi:hypothetical protein